jgi:hypothetical protein
MKTFFAGLLFLLVAACANESDKQATNDDISMEDTTTSVDYIVPAPSFHQYMQLADSSYTPEKYIPQQPASLDLSISERLDTTALKPFTNLLNYNASKTKALDLFSGNYILTEKAGSQHAERGEPDTELAMIDYTAGTRTRLLYVGPSYLLTDAVWITDSTIGVSGGEIINEASMQPLLWRLDLHKKTVALYRYSDTLNIKMAYYFPKRYRGIVF